MYNINDVIINEIDNVKAITEQMQLNVVDTYLLSINEPKLVKSYDRDEKMAIYVCLETKAQAYKNRKELEK